MSSVNKVILLGRVGQNPEIKDVQGKPLATFSLATSERWSDKTGQVRENTEWHNIEAWHTLADLISNYVKKGDQIYIEGKIKTDSWEQDGIKRYKTKITAIALTFISSNSKVQKEQNTTESAEDNLPF